MRRYLHVSLRTRSRGHVLAMSPDRSAGICTPAKAIQQQVETPLQRDVTARLLLSSP